MAFTEALATTAPELSVTVAVMVPRSACAAAELAVFRNNTMARPVIEIRVGRRDIASIPI